jgi:Domain of unknown function (DUF4198)
LGQRPPHRRVSSRLITLLKHSTTGHPTLLRCARGALVLSCLLLSPAEAVPHDLWVVAGKYRLGDGEVTRVFINNGDVFPESLTLLGEHRVSELILQGPEGRQSLSDFRVDGASLTFEFPPSPAGVYVVALGTRPRRVRLQAEDFEDYLDEEGLSEISTLREERGEGDAAAVERYTKWAKAVIDVGELDAGDDEPWAVPVGETLEIVPLDAPNRVAPGGRLRLRLLFEGEPLAGAHLIGSRASGPERELSVTTDEAGEAAVSPSVAGRWQVRAIHMIRRDEDPEMHWESFWCTLTFEVSPKPSPADSVGGERRPVGRHGLAAAERSHR